MASDEPQVSQVVKIKTTDIGNTRLILLDATNAGYDTVVVQSTHKDIDDVFREISDKPRDCLQRTCALIKASFEHKDVNELYKTDEAWGNFCNDIIVYYCLRNHLENEPIPIIPSYAASMIGLSECILCRKEAAGMKCSKCGVRYCSIECQRADWKFHKAECIPFNEQQNYLNKK